MIEVQELSKRYCIGPQRERYLSLRDELVGWVSHTRRRRKATAGDFLALQDVNLSVAPGEVVGLIGRNGAGKSTLLKILCRITPPSTGRVVLRGRVGSLLEVGTGFHPELTGRENVYLNGAILGMSRKEIAQKYDEIVAFAGIERFMETPVKRYSSGMHVRLAFSVAAHLEPEILVVDEVLAVGDVAFQAKCLQKMDDVAGGGRTILFVSHNIAAIRRLCRRVIRLDAGSCVDDGATDPVVRSYLEDRSGLPCERYWPNCGDAPGDEFARLRSVRVLGARGECVSEVDVRDEVAVEVQYWNLRSDQALVTAVVFSDEEGTQLFTALDSTNAVWRESPRRVGLVTTTCHIPGHLLNEGRLVGMVVVMSVTPSTVDHVLVREAVGFAVHDSGTGESARGNYPLRVPGVIRPLLRWSAELNSTDSHGSDGLARLPATECE